MKITVPDDYQLAAKNLACLELLKKHEVTILGDLTKYADANKILAETECLVLIRERTKVDHQMIQRMPRLKLISQTGKIGRHIDLEACNRAGIAVVEGVGSPVAPAELTWALIMDSRRKITEAVVEMKNGNWQSNIGETLHGQTLGIWGYGKIGRIIAGYGRAFGMNVQIWGGEKSREKALEDGFAVCAAKEALFETSDVLTVHLRLVPETAAIITGEDLARMKTSALFVNTSRAELVENGALETALKVGRPGFAALDVYYEEPLYDTESALLRLPNALCTPHLGYVEKNSYELYFRKAFENVLAFIAGEPKNLVNPGALKGK